MGHKLERIWVISELYYPEETSTGHFLTGIAEGLAQKYSVNVLCGQPTYSKRGIRAPVREVQNGVNIHRFWATTLNKDIFPFRLLNLITISISSFFIALRWVHKGDNILVVTNPPLLPFLIAVVAKFRKAGCNLLIHDIYPEVLVVTGVVRAGTILERFLSVSVRWLYRNVQQIIVLGRDVQSLVRNKLCSNDLATVVIPNWGDVEHIAPGDRANNRILIKQELESKFVIQYSGNMGRTHGLEIILQAAKRLNGNPQIHFLFIGWGAKRQWLEDEVDRQNLSNVTFMDYVARDDLNISMNACDVAIISFIPGMVGVSVPSRMYDVMAAGKPIIAVADRDSELALVVQEEQIGWIVFPNQAEQLVDIILEASVQPEKIRQMGARARRVAETKYSYERVIEAYQELFESLQNDKS